jgi:protein-tyrosine kinase
VSVIETALDKLRRAAGPAKIPSDPVGANVAGMPFPGRPVLISEESVQQHAKAIAVDMPRLRAEGYLPEEREERRFADYYREIKRPLIRKALAPDTTADLRFILVSSALPGEGKTFTTLNLAFSMAREHDISVLLIDADIPNPQISRALGLQGEPGLMDALRDDTQDPESFVLGTDVPGLDLLPAGTASEGAAELIASARMAQVAARLSLRNPRRLVVLDSPPVLASSEARALLHIPGQVILVVRAGQTPRQALQDAIVLVDKRKLNGVVLNDATVGAGDGYYYGYGYSTYGPKSAQPPNTATGTAA